MPDWGLIAHERFTGATQMESTTSQCLANQIPHAKFDSNRADSLRKKDVFVPTAKIGGRPASPSYRGPIGSDMSRCRAQLDI